MIPLFVVAVSGFSLVAGYITRRPRPTLLDLLATPVGPVGSGLEGASAMASAVAALQTSFQHIDNQYQSLIVAHLDPWFVGPLSSQQILELIQCQQKSELSIQEKSINRNLLLGGSGLVLIGVSRLTGWIFTPIFVVIGIHSLWPSIQESWKIAVDERRLSFTHLMLLYFLFIWLGESFAIGCLGILLEGICNKFELLAQMVNRHGLTHFLGNQPSEVRVIKDGREFILPFQSLRVGDLLLLNAGELVPVDGVIVQGMATVDLRKLTGESHPVEKLVDDTVLATSLVLAGTIHLRVEKAGADTAAAHITAVLNNTVESQEVRVSDQYNDLEKYRLPMLAGGAFGWILRGPNTGLAMLGTNFMGSLIPLRLLTLLNGLGAGAAHGILIKDSGALDHLSGIDTVVIDKTGTSILDEQIVTQIHCCAQRSEAEVLAYAAATKYRQSHPDAKAIVSAAEQRALAIPPLDNAHYTLGLGSMAQIHGRTVLIGNERFLKMHALVLPVSLQDINRSVKSIGNMLLFVVEDSAVIGALELAFVARQDAKDTLNWLRQTGLALVLVSADDEAPTAKLAADLGMDGYFAETLPSQKAERVQHLQAQGRSVCFIGDGVSDALALRQADVSISLRGATTVATDAAQIVLMNEDMTQLRMTWELALGFEHSMANHSRRSLLFSLLAASGVLILPFDLFMTELLWGVQVIAGVMRSRHPLLEADREVSQAR